MDIYLIRHTRVAIDSGICYGQSEIELAADFDDQVVELRPQLPQTFDVIYSSPTKRCAHLAQQFGDGIEQDNRLLEYDFGEWEMRPWDDIDSGALHAWMQDFVNVRPPGGETLMEMFDRVQEFLDGLRQSQHSRVLITTHAGVIRCVWASLLHIPLVQIFKINVGYGTILHIQLSDNPDHDIVFAH